MFIPLLTNVALVKPLRNVINRVQILRSHLRNMQINHKSIVSKQLPLFLLSQASSIKIASLSNMLMRKNNTRLTVDITWSGKVVDSKVVSTLVLINLEEKVFASDHFIVG